MKIPFIKVLITIIIIVSFCACNENDSELTFGEDYINSGSNLTLVDTVTVEFSTIKLDSIQTSQSTKLLVGYQNDDDFGELIYTSYFKVNSPGVTEISANEVYDSIVLILSYSSYSGDTMAPFSLFVHQISEDFELNDDGYLYNVSSVDYYPNEIGQKTFLPKPRNSDSIAIKINDEIGEYLFMGLKNNDENVTTSENFIKNFKGLALVGNNQNNKAILGFQIDDGSEFGNERVILRLYSHGNHEYEDEGRHIDFPINIIAPKFYQIEHNYSNTLLSSIKSQQDIISSEESNDRSFLQAGSGWLTHVRFPYLNELLLIDKGVIIKAELVFSPVRSTYNDMELPTDLVLFASGKKNVIEGQLASDDGDVVISDLLVDYLYNENSAYSFDITTYILNGIQNQYFDETKGLLISFNAVEMSESLNKLLIDTRELEPRLKLHVLNY